MGSNSNWKIYTVENLLNGMVYVGKTNVDVNEDIQKVISRPSLLGKHVKDLGIGNFKVTVVEECLDDIEVLSKRMLYIKKYNCKKPRGYNDVKTVRKSY